MIRATAHRRAEEDALSARYETHLAKVLSPCMFLVGRVASGFLHVGENKREKFGLRALVSAETLRGIMAIWFLVVGNSRGQERRAEGSPQGCYVCSRSVRA